MIYLKTALDLTVGMIAIIILIRVTGKKTLTDLTPFDLVYLLIIGGLLEQIIYEENNPIFYALWGFLVWGVLILLVERWAVKGDRFRHQVKGRPAVLVWNGMLNREELDRHNIDLEQLRSMIRQQGYFSVKKVQQLVLEINGKSSIVENEAANNYLSYLLVEEGTPEPKVLETIGKNEDWLYNALDEKGYSEIAEIFYCEWSKEDGFYIRTYDETEGKNVYIDG